MCLRFKHQYTSVLFKAPSCFGFLGGAVRQAGQRRRCSGLQELPPYGIDERQTKKRANPVHLQSTTHVLCEKLLVFSQRPPHCFHMPPEQCSQRLPNSTRCSPMLQNPHMSSDVPRCCQVLLAVPFGSMVPVAADCLQMLPNARRWFQMLPGGADLFPDATMCSQMPSDGCSQVPPDAPRCSQMLADRILNIGYRYR